MEQAIKDLKELFAKRNFTEVIHQGTPIMERRKQEPGEYDFDSVYEQMIFTYGLSLGSARQAPHAYGAVCLLVGSAHLEREEYGPAREAFELAAKWNPVGTQAQFSLCETAKMRGDTDEVFRRTRLMLPVCYTGSQLSRCYRNFGYCASNNGNQDDAADFYYTALAFGDDGDEISVRGELAFLTLQMQRVLKEPTPDGVRDLFARYQLPFGFHPMHAQLAQILLEQAREMNAGDLQQQAEVILREVSPQ